MRLMLPILWRIGIVAGRNRVLAPDSAINAVDAKLTTPLVRQHLARRVYGRSLGIVNTGGARCIIPLVRPFAVLTLVH